MTHRHDHDPACEAAHGHAPADRQARTLVAVFASPVAECLLRYGAELGFRTILLEPDPARTLPGHPAEREPGPYLDAGTDVVLTDHHREEIGPLLRDLLATPARWIGIMGTYTLETQNLPILSTLKGWKHGFHSPFKAEV
ncbi:SPFH domain-containing protein, partial [Nonomuraea sp. NPDC055795]